MLWLLISNEYKRLNAHTHTCLDNIYKCYIQILFGNIAQIMNCLMKCTRLDGALNACPPNSHRFDELSNDDCVYVYTSCYYVPQFENTALVFSLTCTSG